MVTGPAGEGGQGGRDGTSCVDQAGSFLVEFDTPIIWLDETLRVVAHRYVLREAGKSAGSGLYHGYIAYAPIHWEL